MLQTILGANGVIATEIAKALPQYTDRIRLVSRHPKQVNPADETVKADLLHYEETLAAVKGSEIVYLTAGLTYNIKTWEQQWPVIMRNVIDACKAVKAKLVFFDNVYMYGQVDGTMTENTPIQPTSKKGQVRAQIAQMLLDEVEKGHLNALIARAADFYGPQTPLSFVTVMVFNNLAKGKKAQWMLSDQHTHSLTYTPDAGKATALLGNTPDAYNQVWHLPTAAPITGKAFIAEAAAAFGRKPAQMVIPRWMLQAIGLFVPAISESMEMLYQYDRDYVFSSHKFETRFGIHPTPYQQGIEAVVASMK